MALNSIRSKFNKTIRVYYGKTAFNVGDIVLIYA